jgi:hypothetical protein
MRFESEESLPAGAVSLIIAPQMRLGAPSARMTNP